VITIQEKSKCCGCAACANICPQNCITMAADEEGFPYPEVDQDKCINCCLCNKVCPILHKTQEIPCKQTAYLVQHKNESVRQESTSGGAFTAIAQYVIRHGGVYSAQLGMEIFMCAINMLSRKRIYQSSETANMCKVKLEILFSRLKVFLKSEGLSASAERHAKSRDLRPFYKRTMRICLQLTSYVTQLLLR
jgi:NAD-dependent dihydropyrimidine dehydrogenase PreA subunit